jgi:hypothetical protein
LKVFHKKLKIECIDVLRFLKLKVFEGFLDATFEIFDPSKKLFNTYILKFPLFTFFQKTAKMYVIFFISMEKGIYYKNRISGKKLQKVGLR